MCFKMKEEIEQMIREIHQHLIKSPKKQDKASERNIRKAMGE